MCPIWAYVYMLSLCITPSPFSFPAFSFLNFPKRPTPASSQGLLCSVISLCPQSFVPRHLYICSPPVVLPPWHLPLPYMASSQRSKPSCCFLSELWVRQGRYKPLGWPIDRLECYNFPSTLSGPRDRPKDWVISSWLHCGGVTWRQVKTSWNFLAFWV